MRTRARCPAKTVCVAQRCLFFPFRPCFAPARARYTHPMRLLPSARASRSLFADEVRVASKHYTRQGEHSRHDPLLGACSLCAPGRRWPITLYYPT